MIYFCLRVDMDYVPWDTPDAREFGHGEPAVILRLLDFARSTGYKFHFFASNRNLRAFPAASDAVLNDGHDLDWYCKHPEAAGSRFAEALPLFRSLGHAPQGMCVKGSWPADCPQFEGSDSLRFLSAAAGPAPEQMTLFPVETRPVREAIRAGLSARAWADSARAQLREAASRNRGLTMAVRPQVLARFDPKLQLLSEILDLATAVGATPRTLRDLLT